MSTPVTTAAPARVSAPARARRGNAPLALQGVFAALLPPEFGGPDPRRMAALCDRLIRHIPPEQAVAIRTSCAALDTAARIAHGAPLVALDADTRAGVVARAARMPGTGDLVDVITKIVLLVDGLDGDARRIATAMRGSALARPDAPLAITPSDEWPHASRCDVVVVGSGAGGAWVARELAAAGRDVVVVEEGRAHAVAEIRGTDPIDRLATLYRDAGSTLTIGVPPLVLPMGRAVGGTTVINSGTCFRAPERVLRSWRAEHGLAAAAPDVIDPAYDDVEATLAIAPSPDDVLGRNAHLMLDAMRRLGWHGEPLRRNAPGCAGAAQCALGCPRNAKLGVHLGVLPAACASGARIVSDARVRHLEHDHGRVTGVVVERPDGTSLRIDADTVVVCAGATETPLLLRRSGLARHPRLGRNLSIHPTATVAGVFDEPVHPWQGVMQSVGSEQFHERDGILLEATATPPGLGSFAVPGTGAELVRRARQGEHLALFGAMIADEPVGRVLGRRRATVVYRPSRRDLGRLYRSIELMSEALFAVGAREVLPSIGGVRTPPRSIGEVRDLLARTRPMRLRLAAFHPTGTAAAGSSATRHPVDGTGRLRGVDGVWVADASVLPSCPEVNPQVTIMALARTIARTIAG